MKVKDIINRVILLYHDEDYVRMTEQQYLRFLDDALLQLILSRPDAHEKREVVKLTTGARQTVPADAYTLLDVYLNKIYIQELDTYLDGKPVYQVSRKDLDYFSNWYSTTGNTESINEFAFDLRTPKNYWVNPPVTSTPDVYIEIGYSYGIDPYADTTDTFAETLEKDVPVSVEFRNALVNYMLYLCYSVDSTSQYDRTVADKYLQMFIQLTQLDDKASLSASSRIIENTTRGIGLYSSGAQPVANTATTPSMQQR